MGDTGERDLVPTNPPSGSSDENTVEKLTNAGVDVSVLTKQQRYVRETKASDAEREQADSIPFTTWMVTLD